jgi:DNA-binding XRE family transcriptional regulator
MTQTPKLDFSKVELLRNRLGLSSSDVAAAIGVSRMTYYLWVRGGNMRQTQASRVKKVVKVMLDLMKDKQWEEEVMPLPPPQRRERLLALVS